MAKTKVSDDTDFLAEARKRYERGYDKDRLNIDAAYDDLKFRAGRTEDQWPPEAITARANRPILTINRIPQFIRQVTGDMRLSKPGIKVVPVDDSGDKKTAEVRAGLIRYIEQRSAARFAYTKAADSQVAAGIGHWQVVSEYAGASTMNQELRIVAVEDGVSVIWDPDAVLPTREDAMWCFVPVDISSALFKERYPEANPGDFGEWQGWGTSDTVRIARYWEKRPEKKKLAVLPGSIIDLTNKTPEEAAALQALGATIEERDSFCLYHSLIAAGSVLEPAQKWPGLYIPVVPVVGEEVCLGRETVRHGIVRYVKDPQRMYNYHSSAQTEVTALQPKAPWLVTDEQVKKYIPEWEQANSDNRPYLRYTPDTKAPPPSRIAPPVSSQGISEGLMRAVEDMQAVTGIYNSSLGQRSNESSGKAINARDRQVEVGTFVYQDNWALSIEHTGRIINDLIPHFYDSERAIRILGEDGKIETFEINRTQRGPVEEGTAPLVTNDMTVGAYDVVIETGPSYSTRREEAKEGMTAFAQSNPDAAAVIMDLIADGQDWPNKDKVAKRLRAIMPPHILAADKHEGDEPPPPAPPDPMQEMAKRLEIGEMAAGIDKTRAEAANKEADTQTRQLQNAAVMGHSPELVQAIATLTQHVQQQGEQLASLAQALGTNRAA